MLFIRLDPTARAVRYCKRDNIDVIRIQHVLNFIGQYIDNDDQLRIIDLSLDIDCRKADSEYNFQSRHILIAGIGQKNRKIKTRKGRLKYLFEHLVHEFRHCIQEIVFGKDASDITYESTDDAEYDNDPLEKDASWFEEKFAKKSLELYFALKKAKAKDTNVFHG